MLGLKLIHVSKGGPCSEIVYIRWKIDILVEHNWYQIILWRYSMLLKSVSSQRGRAIYIYIYIYIEYTSNGSDISLSPVRRPASIWTNTDLLLYRLLGNKSIQVLIKKTIVLSKTLIWKCSLQNDGHFVAAPWVKLVWVITCYLFWPKPFSDQWLLIRIFVSDPQET